MSDFTCKFPVSPLVWCSALTEQSPNCGEQRPHSLFSKGVTASVQPRSELAWLYKNDAKSWQIFNSEVTSDLPWTCSITIIVL